MDLERSLLPPELEGRVPTLSPRLWLSTRIRDWLRADDRFLILSGGPGTGKTMMAALTLADQTDTSSDIWVASYFCSNRLTGYSRNPRHFISTIQEYLLTRHPAAYLKLDTRSRPLIDATATISAETISGSATGVRIAVGQLTTAPLSIDDYFQTAILEPLETIASTNPGQRIGILVDGLDDAPVQDGYSITSLINEYIASFPRVCRVLLTSQNDPSILEPLLSGLPDVVHIDLSESSNRQAVHTDLRVHARAAIERSDIISRTSAVGLSEQIAQAAQGNFLHAESLVRELISGASIQADILRSIDLPDYYLNLFNRLEIQVTTRLSTGIAWRDDCLSLLYLLSATQSSPVPYSSISQLLGRSEAAIYEAIRAVATLLQLDGSDQVGLEHQYVAQFLFSPTLSGHRPNRYGSDEENVQERILQRIAMILSDEWNGEWNQADEFTASHLPGYLARLQNLAPEKASRYYHELQLKELILSLIKRADGDAEPTQAIGTLLRVLRNVESMNADFIYAVLKGGASNNPYVRAAVLDVIRECSNTEPGRAELIVGALLRQANENSWQTAFDAIMSLESRSRNAAIRWVATRGSDELRRHLANVLYLLVGGNAKMLAAEMLDAVTDEISILRPARSKLAIDFIANVSITGYINNCDDAEVTQITNALWRHMTVDRLHLNILNRRLLERPIVSAAAKQLANRVVEVFHEQLTATESERAIILRLLPGLVPGADLSSLLEPIRDGFASGRWTPRVISACVTSIQAASNISRSRNHLDEIFQANTGEGRIWQIASFTVLIKATPDQWVGWLQSMLGRLLDENQESLYHYLNEPEDPDLDLLFTSLWLALAKHGAPIPGLLWDVLSQADTRLRRSMFDGLSVVGLYYPGFALATLNKACRVVNVELIDGELARTLARVAYMHRTLVDVFVRETKIVSPLPSATQNADMEFAHRHIDALGLYNNAVHQGINYPIMRSGLLHPGFVGLAESRNAAEFVKYYAPKVLRLLKDADYELIRWTK